MLVETVEGLGRLVEELSGADVVAVDTEFHGEKRYWPELFLVQIATDEVSAAVDPLAVDDLSPLAPLLADESTIKAFHSAKNDIAILRRRLDVEVGNVFDTQIAAAFLGYGEQCGLTFLLREVCGIRTQKRFSMSDWSRRPLSEEQLRYALDDVKFLVPLYRSLAAGLEKLGRLEWCLSETRFLSSPVTYETSVETVFLKTRSSGKLRRGGEGVLWELVRWRERVARAEDRPRQKVVSDSLLRRIAGMAPSTMEDLERLRGMPGGFLDVRGEDVVRTVRKALESPPSDVPGEPRRKSDPGASARRDILRIYAKCRSSELGIARTVLLPRETISELSSSVPGTWDELRRIPGMDGWRCEVLGEDLLAILKGEMSFSLASDPEQGVRFSRSRPGDG